MTSLAAVASEQVAALARRRRIPRPGTRVAGRRCFASVHAMAGDRSCRAALFDLDGTLLDIEPLSTEAINRHIEPLGGHCDALLKKRILGKRAAEWTRIVIDECKLHGKTSPEELEQAWEANLMELYPSAAALPGVAKLVMHLHQHGVPLAIATSSSRAAVQAKRRNHEALFGRFDAIVTAEDIVRGKPAPDVFLAAAQALGVPPTECCVFEDATAGVDAGLAAGCVVVAVPDRRIFTAVDELHHAGFGNAHELLDTMEQFAPERWGFPPYQ